MGRGSQNGIPAPHRTRREFVTPQSISAVIPCYNTAAFLEEAVRSAMTQTRKVDEVIVIDDGSTDESRAVAERLGVVCIRMPAHAGPGAARNRGIAAARGELIAFLDADDYCAPTHCEDVASLLERHSDCAVAFSRIRRFDQAEESLSRIYLTEDFATPILWHLIKDNIVPQSTAVVRRAILLQHGGYDESRWHSEDYELWLRLSQHHLFVCTNTVTASYRLHPGQATRDLESMLRGRWGVKHQFWQDATTRESAVFVRRLEAALLSVWDATLKAAWWARDDRLFLAALALHELVPGSVATRKRWLRRYGTSWRAWVMLGRAWDGLPGSTKNFARPVLASLFSPPRGISSS
jgi:glycosyltransferase involved in cell wall biosynthesis